MTNIHAHERDDAAAKPRKPQRDEDNMELFWLEFHAPETGKFLGVCIVPAERENFIEAVKVSHALGCNGGGQVAWVEVENLQRVPREYLAKLLNADQVVVVMKIIRQKKMQ
jgi:hypothetical protein